MNDITEHSHLPCDGKVRPLGYYLGVHFFPAMKLTPREGHEFAALLSGYFDIGKTAIDAGRWSFASEQGNFTVQVGKTQLELHGEGPEDRQERYEERYSTVLRRFHDHFSPRWVMASKAMLRGLVAINGDARLFLAGRVMNLDPARLLPLKRKLHVLGMRLSFSKDDDGQGNPDWDADVKVESWSADPSQLFVEVNGTWTNDPVEWNESAHAAVVARLSVVTEYIDDTIIPFLTHEPTEEE